MIGSALALKVTVATIAGGALISSVTVPTVMALKAPPSPPSPSEIVINGFPVSHKVTYSDTCQVLIKDSVEGMDSTKYLFACNESEGYSPAIYFYVDGLGEKPDGAKITKEKEERGKIKLKVVLTTNSSETFLMVSPVSWINWLEKGFEGCGFINNEEKSKPWTIKCPKEGPSSTEIPLIPVIIN